MIEKADIENLLKNIIDPNVVTDLVSAQSVKSIAVRAIIASYFSRPSQADFNLYVRS
jgi:hypothetical protein